MAKEKSIGFYLKHRPPLTVSMIMAALLLLQSSKGVLIHNLPIENKALIDALSGWYGYLLDVAGTLMALAGVFLGVKTTDKPDTDNPLQ